MSLYNMLFGMNAQSDLLLAVLGLKKVDVERLRDCHASEDGKTISIYTRTGGGNRSDYPNLKMRKLPTWQGSEDDDYDSTYCTDEFEVPEEWRGDVAGLRDIIGNGLRREFCALLSATINRDPTDDDISQAKHDAEARELGRTKHFMANGHTFVPMDDGALLVALKLAEANGGELMSAWGIAPIALTVRQNFVQWPGAKPPHNDMLTRVEVGYDPAWSMDLEYWERAKKRFGDEFPKAIARIQETVDNYTKKKVA